MTTIPEGMLPSFCQALLLVYTRRLSLVNTDIIKYNTSKA